MEDEDNEPDCFDLNDWCVLREPAFYASVKYLSPSVQYKAMREFWISKGRPEIRGVWPV